MKKSVLLVPVQAKSRQVNDQWLSIRAATSAFNRSPVPVSRKLILTFCCAALKMDATISTETLGLF